METKECQICNEEKNILDFYQNKNSCKKCYNRQATERRKIRYHTDDEYKKKINKRRVNRKVRENRRGDGYHTRQESYKIKKQERERVTQERLQKKVVQKSSLNGESKNRKSTIRRLKRYNEDPVYRMKLNIKSSIRKAFKKISSNGKPCPTQEILGTNYNDFFKYIESLFQEGMTWNNRGKWHIDHIVPISIAQTIDEVKYLNHHTNLRPIWAKENMSKGDRIDESNIDLYNKFLKEMRNIS